MPLALPISILRGPPRKADILLDSTCFSSADFEDLSDFDGDSDTEDNSHSHLFNLFSIAHPINMSSRDVQDSEAQADIERRVGISNNALDTRARYTHPTFPRCSFYTTLLQTTRFRAYIAMEFPGVTSKSQTFPLTTSGTSTTLKEPLRKEVNATIANTLLNTNIPTNIATFDWIQDYIFPDSELPTVFDKKCLDDVAECWDLSSQKFSHFPDATLEQTVQDWLNHLAHVLGVKHNLIVKIPEEEPAAEGIIPEEIAPEEIAPEELMPAAGSGEESTPGAFEKFASEDSMYASEEEVDKSGNSDETHQPNDAEDQGFIVDNGVEERGFVVNNAEDRSFSMISHKQSPTGGYRPRKPDIILLNRNIRHFLHEKGLRPRWLHVEAVLEVSSSASRESMVMQIMEKTALMFEAQPFRRFAIGLAFRGTTAKGVEFCFVLVDRSGVCITHWTNIDGYGGIKLARIIFALIYGKPALLGIDTSMTIDILSGNVIKIRVQEREFVVVKHIHASLVLFGRGTHVFLVRDENGQLHILKDAWILVDHGISEIEVLKHINACLEKDSSKDSQTYRSLHPRFIVGEEIGDSTTVRRGRLTDPPPERVHRRVVTGPVGDPLSSFRSREEFVKVLLDCVKCKSGVQYWKLLTYRFFLRA